MLQRRLWKNFLFKIEEAAQNLFPYFEHRNSNVRSYAVTWSVWAGENAVPHLIRILHHDQDSFVRASAVGALGSWVLRTTPLTTTKRVSALISSLNDPEKWVRGKIAESLGDVGGNDRRTVPALVSMLKDESHWVRVVVARALGRLKNKNAVLSLIHGLKHDKDGSVRGAIAASLGQIMDRRSFAVLVMSIRDQDDYVRLKAVQALSNFKGEKTIEFLKPVLKDSNGNIQLAAAISLVNLGYSEAIDIIVSHLQGKKPDPDDYRSNSLLRQAAEVLVQRGNPAFAKVLKEYGGEEWELAIYKSAAQKAIDTGKYADAIVYYDHLIEKRPNDFTYPLRQAEVYQKLGRIEEAITNCKKSIAICSDCDGLAAKRLLAELEEVQRQRNFLPPTVFIGFADFQDAGEEITDKNIGRKSKSLLDEGLKKEITDSILRELKANWIRVSLPNIESLSDKLQGYECTEAGCTAEIAGAMDLEGGFFGAVTLIPVSQELRFSLSYVQTENATELHRVSVTRKKQRVKTSSDAQAIARELVQKMVNQLKS
ncbi:MAG: hypothetical protein A3I05_09735 [Deltaproteobacteria bacterium RIFCSPLOWO2_02_FULL_44_10]|nr:MAG: hypothetical protein A3C46_06515 [Deltaproteobacteria bacterium RIFCSPHIGHO2_02_FULL_44_16]OGQ46479.1 MAG: hypothetical protein A3I05_09735 [Deltaproteobacteria bacterium RIFCSPLOWO2_02_FULL_44_10]